MIQLIFNQILSLFEIESFFFLLKRDIVKILILKHSYLSTNSRITKNLM